MTDENLIIVKKRKPLLIIMDGQSNNGGQGNINDLPSYLTSHISNFSRIYYNSQDQVLTVGANNNGQMLDTNGDPWYTGYHGSELELAYRLNKAYPNRFIYFVKTGQGGRPLGQDAGIEDFYPTSSSQLHQIMLDNVDAYLTLLSKTIDGFEVWYVWMQGEYDCRTEEDVKANAYKINLTAKITAVRTDLGNQNIKFIINVINSSIDRDTSLISIVRQAQIDVANNTENVYYQLSEDWPDKGDNLHFNSEGQIMKGLGESKIIMQN